MREGLESVLTEVEPVHMRVLELLLISQPIDVCSKANCKDQSTSSTELLNVNLYAGTNLPCYCQIGIKRDCAPGTVFSKTDGVCVFPG